MTFISNQACECSVGDKKECKQVCDKWLEQCQYQFGLIKDCLHLSDQLHHSTLFQNEVSAQRIER